MEGYLHNKGSEKNYGNFIVNSVIRKASYTKSNFLLRHKHLLLLRVLGSMVRARFFSDTWTGISPTRRNPQLQASG